MKKTLLKILLISFFSINVNADTNFYGGVEAGLPLTIGISGKMDLTDKVTMQGIVGFLGELSNYSAKAIYKIDKKKLYDLYAYGLIGVWKWDDDYFDEHETTMGYGIGGGLEFKLQELFGPQAPPLYMSGELGFDKLDLEYVEYTGLHIGGAIHYRF